VAEVVRRPEQVVALLKFLFDSQNPPWKLSLPDSPVLVEAEIEMEVVVWIGSVESQFLVG
jgi:hypothetical protein